MKMRNIVFDLFCLVSVFAERLQKGCCSVCAVIPLIIEIDLKLKQCVCLSYWTRQLPCRNIYSSSMAVHLGNDTGSARQSPCRSVSSPSLAVHLGNDTGLNFSKNENIICNTGSSYLTKANSASSSRVRAAFTAHVVSSLLMTGKAKRKFREKIVGTDSKSLEVPRGTYSAAVRAGG